MTTERIDIDPTVMMGKPVIRGTRITVELILRKLAEGTSEGDLLAILDVGAYGSVLGSNYNTRGRAAEVLVDGAKWNLARRRETYEDLVRGED